MADAALTKTFQFELVSPERVLASEQVSMVTIPGENGEFGVLAGHAPMLSSLRAGVVTMTNAQQEQRRVFVSGGFADVNGTICSLLAEEAINVEDLDRATLEASLKTLADDLTASQSDAIKSEHIQLLIDVTQAKLRALSA